jgi:phosphatidylinositol kinase/protein kinase (PI-3  family)
VKSGDDLRQEHMAMELIRIVKAICQKENIKIWLRTYSVIPFDKDSGFIEFVEDTKTVSYLKERSRATSLK